MTKIFLANRFHIFLTALICFVAVSSLTRADDRFAIAVGAHDKLVVFGPKGERAAEFSVPTIAHPVNVGDISFQVSYGHDANGRLMAILTPDADAPVALHFTVMGRSVDVDKAVVTLIFSPDVKGVTINAGYGGRVEVNSRRVKPSQLNP